MSSAWDQTSQLLEAHTSVSVAFNIKYLCSFITSLAINQGILVSNVLRDVENEREGYYRHALSGAITGAFWLAVYGMFRAEIFFA